MSSGRAESFSDGVFAVAITVLVFDLLPIGSASRHLTAHDLLSSWPQYAAYVVSFLTIGIMWMNHHTLLGHVTRVDRPLLVLNLFLLMGVVAIPFPTALLAEHLTSGTSGGSVAAVTYGLVMIAISVGFNAIWQYLIRHTDALGAKRAREEMVSAVPKLRTGQLTVARWSAGLFGYIAGTVVAVFSAGAALAIFGALAVFYLFNHLPDPAAPAGPGSLAG